METKQLILEKHCGKVSVIYRINAYAAMQEYAEYYHTSQTEMPSDEDTLKYFYHIGGRDKLMNINLKNKVTFGDRLEEFKQNSASQTEMPSEEFEIDFDRHVKAKISIKNNVPKVIAAMNGYGDPIRIENISLFKLKGGE